MVVAWSGATGQQILLAEGTQGGESFGRLIIGVDDADGDGAPEILTSNGVDLTLIDEVGAKRVVTNPLGALVSSLGRAGDLDGDGIDEFLVGSHLYSGAIGHEGLVQVWSGANATPLGSFTGLTVNDLIGYAVTGIDDLDHDGVRDLVASGRQDGPNWKPNKGMLDFRSGATFARLRVIYGKDYDYLGQTLAGLGDWDRDGVDEVAASRPTGGPDDFGAVDVYSGASGARLYEFVGVRDGYDHSHEFGATIAAGDFNGDGLGGIAVGIPRWHDADFEYEGAAAVFEACPAFQLSYGAGWSGTLGIPTLAASPDPVVGQAITLTADCSAGADTLGFLLIGTREALLPLHSGATLLVEPLVVEIVSVPAAGFIDSDEIPDDPALYFADFFLQIAEADLGAAGGLAFTAGLQLRCGFDL